MKKKKRKEILDIPSDEIYPWLRKFSFHFRAPISAKIFEDVDYVTIDIFLCFATLNEQQLEAANEQIK